MTLPNRPLIALTKNAAFTLLTCASLFAAACGSKEDANVPAAAKPAAQTKLLPSNTVEDPTAGMALAVAVSRRGRPVDLKYDLVSKPELGKPLELELALMFTADAKSTAFASSGPPELKISGESADRWGSSKIGQIERRQLLVTAEQPGSYYVTIDVTTDSVDGEQKHVFAIPFIIGSADAASDAKSAVDTIPTAAALPSLTPSAK